MHIICPRCKEHLELDGDCRGMEVECAACNHVFTVPNVVRTRSSEPPKKSKNAYFGCFMMGLLFNLVGVILAYLTSGRPGAQAATRGFLINALIIALFGAIGHFT